MLMFVTYQLAMLLLAFGVFASASSQFAMVPRGGGGPNKVLVVPPNGPQLLILRSFVETLKNARRDLAAAAVARCTSIAVMYPIDTFKTRIQMEQLNPFRMDGIYKGVVWVRISVGNLVWLTTGVL
jgi:hypothetical protein